ncbi:alpha-protein kinase 1 [Biomphalaria glabrata]|nr:alpha-protein kinase 1 [Biomphalaria glabrata]
MSETVPNRPSDCLLHSDQLFQVLGGDAMQILRCGICMEFFDVPIVLPCGHTFCLQCLTEMCKHASRNCVLSPLKDLRIGCPNCRVLIYASPILERNVTCNFIIQSFLECLRSREGGKRLNAGVNTDEVRVGPKIRTVSDIEVEKVIKEVDRLTDSLGKRNVLDNAYFEVDEIRRQHLAEEAKRLEEEEHQQRQKHWNSRSIPPAMPTQLRVQQHPQQQLPPFVQPQQHPRPRPFCWDAINSQTLTLTPHSPFYFPSSFQQPAPPYPTQPQLQPQQQQPQPFPQQQNQNQQQFQLPNISRISKMATVLPLQRCPDFSHFSSSVGQLDIHGSHPSRLDNDPAVMSYSYKAAVNSSVNK